MQMQSRISKAGVGVAVMAACWMALPAQAATDSTTMAVTATVLTACTVAATPLAFGNYDPTAGNTDATATVTVICTGGTPYNLQMSQGTNGVSVSNRRLLSGVSDYLSYALYRDASRTQNWGETNGTDTVSDTGVISGNTHTVYGRIASGSSAVAGAYADTITVTVSY